MRDLGEEMRFEAIGLVGSGRGARQAGEVLLQRAKFMVIRGGAAELKGRTEEPGKADCHGCSCGAEPRRLGAIRPANERQCRKCRGGNAGAQLIPAHHRREGAYNSVPLPHSRPRCVDAYPSRRLPWTWV